LEQYLNRIYSLIFSRRDANVEELLIANQSQVDRGIVRVQLRFWDESLLEIRENLIVERRMIIKYRYTYHYQKGNRVLFRYDNSAHHPHLANFPYHKHTADGEVIPAAPPDLLDILQEIDSILYTEYENQNSLDMR